MKGICDTTGFKDRGVQESDTMSGINWCKIPVTIVEMGFMSNYCEDKMLCDPCYQKKLMNIVADSLEIYKEEK